VDAQGIHVMVCKNAPNRIARHQVLNDIIWRSLGSAGIPATKEPSGLVRQDGKRPDWLTLIPWQGGKSLAWDVTVVSMLAQSYVDRAATGVGMMAELAAERKLMKYSNLITNLIFQPIAVENLGAFSSSSSDFISALAHKISSVSGVEKETSFLLQKQFFCTTPLIPRTAFYTRNHLSIIVCLRTCKFYSFFKFLLMHTRVMCLINSI